MEFNWAKRYRPPTLSKVLGQETAKLLTKGALKSQQVPRTWMIKGPWGTGKTTLSRIIAKILTCSNVQNGEPCCTCTNCKAIDSDTSLNYFEYDSASKGSVDAVKGIIEEAMNSPIDADYKVVTMDEAQLISKQGQSAFLKTLEEGTGRTIFIFATTDPEKILGTIVSRCLLLSLNPVSPDLVINHLYSILDENGIHYEREAIPLIVQNTHGHIRDALNRTQQLSLSGEVTVPLVKEFLNLNLDEISQKLLRLSGESWDKAVEEVNSIAGQHSAEELWKAVARSLVQSYLVSLGTNLSPPTADHKALVEKYSVKLSTVSEWMLTVGHGMKIRTPADFLVGLALIREKLGANLMRKQSDIRIGIPRAKREGSLVAPEKVMPVEQTMQALGLSGAPEPTPEPQPAVINPPIETPTAAPIPAPRKTPEGVSIVEGSIQPDSPASLDAFLSSVGEKVESTQNLSVDDIFK